MFFVLGGNLQSPAPTKPTWFSPPYFHSRSHAAPSLSSP